MKPEGLYGKGSAHKLYGALDLSARTMFRGSAKRKRTTAPQVRLATSAVIIYRIDQKSFVSSRYLLANFSPWGFGKVSSL